MKNDHKIVAYWNKGQWLTVDEVEPKREDARRRGDTNPAAYFPDANPYTVAALRRRREYGKDVPEWVNLDEEEADHG